jgi:hypothetical protein
MKWRENENQKKKTSIINNETAIEMAYFQRETTNVAENQ